MKPIFVEFFRGSVYALNHEKNLKKFVTIFLNFCTIVIFCDTMKRRCIFGFAVMTETQIFVRRCAVSFLLRDKSDIKIFVLYLLRQIETPLDFGTLHDIVVQDEFVGQFDFMECFFELCEMGAIMKTEKEGKDCYSLTPNGRNAADALQSDLLRTIRERALRSARRFLEYQKNGCKTESEVIELEGGKCRLVCKCMDRDGVYMETSVVLENRHKAELLKLNFDDRSEFIYAGIMSLLSGDMNYLLPDDGDADDDRV